MSPLTVLGAGAFGTALAIALARDGIPVVLVARTGAKALDAARENGRYLPGIPFPEALEVSDRLDRGADPVLLAIPMQSLAALLSSHAERLDGRPLVACCKGVDLSTGRGPTGLLGEACPGGTPAMLTGPSFAQDIARGLPTALTLACADSDAGAALQSVLACETLRLYLSTDVIGAELGGALKNVIALAAGMAMGAGLGESARAAVITRGFAEMLRVATALGAQPETLTGLSGLGDLVLTATSEKSRNYRAGIAFGAGRAPDPGQTIEGIATAQAMTRLAEDRGFDAPLTQTVASVARGDLTVSEARDILLARPLRTE